MDRPPFLDQNDAAVVGDIHFHPDFDNLPIRPSPVSTPRRVEPSQFIFMPEDLLNYSRRRRRRAAPQTSATGDTLRSARRREGDRPARGTRSSEDRHTPETPERRPATPQTPEQESRRAELRRRHTELVGQRIRAGDDDPARETSLEVESGILDELVEDVGRFSDDFREMSTLPGQDPRDDDAFRDTLRRGHEMNAETRARADIERDQRQHQRVQRDLERAQRQHQRAEQERVNREYWDQQARLPR